MEQYDITFGYPRRFTFDEIPGENIRTVFGEPYAFLSGMQGGNFFVTREGWSWAEALCPRRWFVDERYRLIGRGMLSGTGVVYRVPIDASRRRPVSMIIKFSRFGQDLGAVNGELCRDSLLFRNDFLSPFEEIARLRELRRSRASERVRTALPLGIYIPPEHYPDWQLGRSSSARFYYNKRLEKDQAGAPHPPVTYAWEQLAVLLYTFVEGLDLQEAADQGLVPREALPELTNDAAKLLATHGFKVLDHKARHLIVRPDPHGRRLRQKNGRPAYALIDYELLTRHPQTTGG